MTRFNTSRQSVAAKSRNCNYHKDNTLSLDERARLWPDLTYELTEQVIYLDSITVTNQYDTKVARAIERFGFVVLVASQYAHLYYVTNGHVCTCGRDRCEHIESAKALLLQQRKEQAIQTLKAEHPDWFLAYDVVGEAVKVCNRAVADANIGNFYEQRFA